ncbi:MAG: sensor histidine kinase [Streptococcus gordonii]|nr:sensor histidine kinase [Streptococcus gordonii]
MSKNLKIRPYARLITMLGDQLIKNEIIALVELIKNSYDADASWVKVSFVDFNEDFSINPSSKIVIEDDGCGMDEKILEKHWLNPATPDKLKRKSEKTLTDKGRIMQGEKGIGRFAIFKLGKDIKIISRRQKQTDKNSQSDKEIIQNKFIDEGEDVENYLSYNFSNYDDNFLSENGEEKELFLDDLNIVLETEQSPKVIIEKKILLGTSEIVRKPYGTRIEISDLKSNWTAAKIEKVQREIGKMQPIFAKDDFSDFHVWIYQDENIHISQERYKEKLAICLENKSVFKVKNGKFDSSTNEIKFELNDRTIELSFNNSDITGLRLFQKYFKDASYITECGDFRFEFYIFDLKISSENPSKYMLDKEEKDIIKEHRIYLYRDNIRVMPYGDPDDDWLRIDMARGTVSAAEFLSNDQVVGCVYITQEGNPKLKDKTNREGLIEEGKALEDFINVLQLILKYLRKKVYAQYLIDKKRKVEIDHAKKGRPLEIIEKAKKKYKNDDKALKIISNFETSYRQEQKVLFDRIDKTESLAAVGLSIETASHDIMLFIKKTLDSQDALIKELMLGGEINQDELLTRLTLIRGNLSMVETQMKDIQLLFPSTKSKTKNINIRDIIDKVYGLYKRPFAENGIKYNIYTTSKPLIVKTTDAVLLQVLINLFDNALYWLKTVSTEREILISIDGNQQKLIFSDSGPGIKDEDVSYVFEAFYSGKGEEGRGLGLYIAKQLLDKYDYTIELAEFSKDKKLKGANFVMEFIKEVQ